jgi:tetratricopeptide (TPR) repeat protein
MDALLAVLEQGLRRRTRAVAVLGLSLLVAVTGAGAYWQGAAHRRSPCRSVAGRLTGVWDPVRKRGLERALVTTGSVHAQEVFAHVADALDRYAADWTDAATDACEATRTRGEATEEALELRMQCLDWRRTELREFVDLLYRPDEDLLRSAVSAAQARSSLASCQRPDAIRIALASPADPRAAAEVARLRVELAQARALFDSGRKDSALTTANAVVAAARRLHHLPLEAESLLLQGSIHARYAPDSKLAGTILEQALLTALRLHYDEVAVRSLVLLAHLEWPRAELDLALRHAKMADAIVSTMPTNAALGVEVKNLFGAVFNALGQPDQALNALSEAIARAEKDLPKDDLLLATALDYRASILRGVQPRQLDESITLARRALAIRERRLGPSHVMVARSLVSLAETLRVLDRKEEGVVLIRRAHALMLANFPPDHPSVADSHLSLGLYAKDMGQLREAEDELRQAEKIYEKRAGASSPSIGVAWGSLGEVLLDSDRPAEALSYFDRDLALEERLNPKHPELLSPLVSSAEALLALGRPAEARARAERALQLQAELGGVGPQRVAVLDILIARAEVELHRPRQALGLLQRAIPVLEREELYAVPVTKARFAMARAMVDLGQDETRALALARTALADFRSDKRFARDAKAVERWIAARHRHVAL